MNFRICARASALELRNLCARSAAASRRRRPCATRCKRRAPNKRKRHRSDPRVPDQHQPNSIRPTLLISVKDGVEPLAPLTKPTPLFEPSRHRHHAALHRAVGDRRRPCVAFRRAAMAEASRKRLGKPSQLAARRRSLPSKPYDYPDSCSTAIESDNTVSSPGGHQMRACASMVRWKRARQQADRVVLSGLVEGVWPPEPRNDPWLNRPMRQELGLDLPERRIGLSAHDLRAGTRRRGCVFTYATKREGAPSVISRFVQRLSAVSGPDDWKVVKARGRGISRLGTLARPAGTDHTGETPPHRHRRVKHGRSACR